MTSKNIKLVHPFGRGELTLLEPRNAFNLEFKSFANALGAKLAAFLSHTDLATDVTFTPYETTSRPTLTNEGVSIKQETTFGINIRVDIATEIIEGILEPLREKSKNQRALAKAVREGITPLEQKKEDATPVGTESKRENGPKPLQRTILTNTVPDFGRPVEPPGRLLSSPTKLAPRAGKWPTNPEAQPKSTETTVPLFPESTPRREVSMKAAGTKKRTPSFESLAVKKVLNDPAARSYFLDEINQNLDRAHTIQATMLAKIGRRHFKIPETASSSSWSQKVEELVEHRWLRIVSGIKSSRRYTFDRAALDAILEIPKILGKTTEDKTPAPPHDQKALEKTEAASAPAERYALEPERILEPLPQSNVLTLSTKSEDEDELMALLPSGLKIFGRFMDAWFKARKAQEEMERHAKTYEDSKRAYEAAKAELLVAIQETSSRAT